MLSGLHWQNYNYPCHVLWYVWISDLHKPEYVECNWSFNDKFLHHHIWTPSSLKVIDARTGKPVDKRQARSKRFNFMISCTVMRYAAPCKMLINFIESLNLRLSCDTGQVARCEWNHSRIVRYIDLDTQYQKYKSQNVRCC